MPEDMLQILKPPIAWRGALSHGQPLLRSARADERESEREREALLVWIVNPEILIAAVRSIVVQFDFRPCWTDTLFSLLQRASLSPLLYIR